MKKVQSYILSDEEYKCFENAVMHIYCPDLGDHNCNLCPMNININRDFPKEPDYRCLLAMMEDKLYAIKETRECKEEGYDKQRT